MAQQWYYQADGVEQGPFAPAEFKRLVGAGRITPQTPVRRDDQAKPVPAGRVNGLFPAGGAAATAVAEPEPVGGIAALGADALRARPAAARQADDEPRGGDPFAPPSDEGDDDRPRRGRGGKRSALEATWRPLVSRRGWLIFGGIIQLVIGGLYVLGGLVAGVAGGHVRGFGLIQLLIAVVFGGVFILMGMLMLRAGTALGRAGRGGRPDDYTAASRAMAGYFTVIGIIFAISVGLMVVAMLFGAISAAM